MKATLCTMESILILNARIVNEGHICDGDVFIKNGRIEKLGKNLAQIEADTTIDATGKHLLPGLIDDQVHFREPGLTHKADIHSESRAAAAGGVTSYMEMPNTNPTTTTLKALEEKYAIAQKDSLVNYAFYLGATNNNVEEIKRLDPTKACGVKIFMGSSTGDMLVDSHKSLEAIFSNSPTLIATHCEHTPTIIENEKQFREKYGDDIPFKYHPKIRSADACFQSSSFAVELARANDARLHILHITTAKELKLFSNAPLKEKKITAEACVHHLFFEKSDYNTKGSLIKCNPAIKNKSDRDAVIKALIDGKIDVIATDHAPHTWEEKQNKYFKAPSGLPLIQHSLQILLELYHAGKLPLELIVQKSCHNVAELFQIKDRGYIREGCWADLVLVDIDKPEKVEKENLHYKCGWSLFESYQFKSTIDTTIVSGQIVYKNGWFDARLRGHRLQFNR